MPNEKQLREALIYAFQHLREQSSALYSVTAEVASVRDALIEIGPKYDEILSRHRARHVKESKPLVFSDFQKFDAIIQQLKTG
jgi:hypothetical protein